MESPVVLDKPPEYHGKSDERGFPFDEDESSGAWSSLAARHPDIAARLRQRPATWARKRRPSSQDATDDFGERFGDFDRFPFDDIPPEFRDHFPTHWGRRFEEPPPQQPAPQQPAPAPASPQPQQASAATQTEHPAGAQQSPHLPQYGLRNTVDLGQKSATDPSVDADDRNQRSVSAPPDARASQPAMSSDHHEPPPDHQANVRHIPIFVEGRDEPVINRTDHAHFAEPKPHYAPPPPPPHIDRDQYFGDDGPATFHHPPNFTRAFGTPFNKGFRQGPQPFVQQKVYPQTAFTRGASPQRSQSPKAQPHPEEQHSKHEPAPRAQPPPPQHPQQHPPQQQPHQQQHPPQQHPPQQQAPPQPPQQPHAASPPPKPQATPKDPITLILSIQTDVLNLMSEVENFVGTKKDKKYIYLDEMLTRNLIKLDNIETEGKENIRQARKEAIKCIEKCIAVLEAKADGRTGAPAAVQPAAAQRAEPAADDKAAENGEVEMKEESTKDEAKADDTQEKKEVAQENDQQKHEEQVKVEAKPEEIKEESKPQAADTRPEENRAVLVEKPEEKNEEGDKKGSPKKSTKVVKKRDKSKDKNKDSPKQDADKEEKVESMQVVDDKGDKTDPLVMEVDGAAASQ